MGSLRNRLQLLHMNLTISKNIWGLFTWILLSSSKTCFLHSSSLGVKTISILSSISPVFLDYLAFSTLMSPFLISPRSKLNWVMGNLAIISSSLISSSEVKKALLSFSSTCLNTYINRVVLLSLALTSLALSTISNLKPEAPPRLDYPLR